jgi:hypothetical protein
MRIFFSYADAERDFARQLAERLLGAGLDVWWDEREIVAGENWAAALQTALEQANAMVVLLSPDAVRSRWVRHEIDYALGTPRFAGRVVPVEVRPTDEVPWVLRSFPYVRAAGDVDQVARAVVAALKPSEN